MTTVKQTFSGTIAASIDEVFRLLTDPKRIPEWLPSCTHVQAPGNELGKGTHFTLAFITRAGRRDVTAEVIEFTPPEIIGWSEIAPRRNTKTFYRLSFSGGSTGIMMQLVSTTSGVFARLRQVWFKRRNATREFERTLQNLQQLLMR